MEPFRTVGYYRIREGTIRDHRDQWGTIWGSMANPIESFKTKWDHGGPYKTIEGDMVCLKTLTMTWEFATLAICNTCNLQYVHFATNAMCNICNLQHVQFETHAINTCNLQHIKFATGPTCNMPNLQHMQFATHEIQNTCNLQHMQLAICATFIMYYARILPSPLWKWRGPYIVSRVVPHLKGTVSRKFLLAEKMPLSRLISASQVKNLTTPYKK